MLKFNDWKNALVELKYWVYYNRINIVIKQSNKLSFNSQNIHFVWLIRTTLLNIKKSEHYQETKNLRTKKFLIALDWIEMNPKTGKWILYISERNLFLAVASDDNIMK